MWLGALWLACAEPDVREPLAAAWQGSRPISVDAPEALRGGRTALACTAFKQRAAAGLADEAAWFGLLVTAARGATCISSAEAETLAGWAREREGGADAVAEWDAAQGREVRTEGLSGVTRLRVAMRRGTVEERRIAAEAAIAEDPTDLLACGFLARDAIDRGELVEAVERTRCGEAAELQRLRAEALDEAGAHGAAVEAYQRAGYTLHAAAILYQELPERVSEAEAVLEEPIPPVLIHRGWMAVLAGNVPETGGLDGSPEAVMLRALAGDAEAAAMLPSLPGDGPLALHARLSGDLSALERQLEAAPDREVWHRLRIGLLQERGGDSAAAVAAWLERDPDHVRLLGNPIHRSAPLAALVPYRWDRLGVPAEPRGVDDLGRRFRAATSLPPAEKAAELRTLQRELPELRGLARLRAQSLLDLSPAAR